VVLPGEQRDRERNAGKGQDAQVDRQPGHVRAPPADRRPHRAHRGAAPSRQYGRAEPRGEAPRERAEDNALKRRESDVAPVIGLVLQVRPAEAQARELAHDAPTRQLGRLLRERADGERRRVGALGARLERHDGHVEQAQHLDRVHRAALLVLALERRPEMQRVDQPDGREGEEHDECHHAGGAARDAPPRRGEMLVAADVGKVAEHDRHQQPDRHVGPQDDRHHSNLTRGSTSV
jgi:hypothetical protein